MDKIEVGEIITITDEGEQSQDVEVLAMLTIENTDYLAVGMVEDLQQETEEDIDIFLLKVDQDGEISAIESDDEFDKVSKAFDEIMDEEE